MFTASHSWRNASEAMKFWTCVWISPLTAPASGPIRSCSRGRSWVTPANAWVSSAWTSTCSSMASVTLVAIAVCTSGESTSGPTVATYR